MSENLPVYDVFWTRDSVSVCRTAWVKVGVPPYRCDRTKTVYTLDDFEEVHVEESCRLCITIRKTALSRPPTLETIVSKYPGVRVLILCSNFQEGYSCLALCPQLEEVIVRSRAQTSLRGIEFVSSLRKLSISTCLSYENTPDVSEPICLDHLDGMMLESLSIGHLKRPVRAGGISLPRLKLLTLKGRTVIDDSSPGMRIPDSCVVIHNSYNLGEVEKIADRPEKSLVENLLHILST